MVKKQLLELFAQYPEDVRKTLARVLDLEQRNISYKSPRVRDDIRKILEEEAEHEA